MKVRITFTVDIDPESWALEYGVHSDDVRQDVREHAEHTVLGQFDSLGLLTKADRPTGVDAQRGPCDYQRRLRELAEQRKELTMEAEQRKELTMEEYRARLSRVIDAVRNDPESLHRLVAEAYTAGWNDGHRDGAEEARPIR